MKKFVLHKGDYADKKVEYQIPYKELLNEAQLKAVFFDEGTALVIAGAGTGKTRTLVHRVARLVESGIHPNKILLLTFTRRAASEMIGRASEILDNRCRKVKGGTFHHYCSQILHQYSSYLDYPDTFTIIDSADSREIFQLCRVNLKFSQQNKRFPNKSTLQSIHSTCVNKNLDLRVVLEQAYPQFLNFEEQIHELREAYTSYKEKNYVMDFDDLLVKTVHLLKKNEDVRKKVSLDNEFVMVDEYQDTNSLQAKLTKLFCSVHGNVMAVGDDAQSIYSFRGADHRNIMDFPELYEQCEVIKLEENYRSTPQILEVANNILKQAQYKFEKTLYSNRDEGELPAYVKARSEHDQSRFITQAVLRLREMGYELNRLAVLFRNGRDSYDLEVELNRKNIPFVKYGGQKFTEAAHIKDILAHVRVLVNPMDTLAWNRVLMLLDGIGPKTARDIYDYIRLSRNPYDFNLNEMTSKSYRHQVDELGKILQELNNNDYPVEKVIRLLVDYYKVFCKKRYDDYPKRIKDLESFVNVSSNYNDMPSMLEELALDPITATAVETEEKQSDENPLILSTIHSAKGLEWDHVFLINCLDGIIPSAYSVEDDESLDEEIRLLYVAATRAKEMLYFSYPVIAQSGYGDYFTQPTRFLEDLDEKIIEEWQLIEEEQQAQLDSPDTKALPE